MVIGIIAVLISILLPALSAARRQAAAAKCAAQMREVGNALQMYAIESKGWYPPAQLQPTAGRIYNVNGTDFPQQGLGAYWYHFLQKYVTKTKLGYAASSAQDRADARRTVLWGCPAWEGWEIESQRVPPPDQVKGQALAINTTAAGNHAFGPGNTLIDAYRHGKYPQATGDGFSLKPTGGKVAFNILYADGHVGASVDRTEAFRACRMRFPE